MISREQKRKRKVMPVELRVIRLIKRYLENGDADLAMSALVAYGDQMVREAKLKWVRG